MSLENVNIAIVKDLNRLTWREVVLATAEKRRLSARILTDL
jgi:hypothetical protein